jgi:hypothetical protein
MNDTALVARDETLSMIERAALNPAVDVEKLERLMAMKERIEARNAETAFSASAGSNQTTDVFDKIFNVLGPKVPMVFPRG